MLSLRSRRKRGIEFVLVSSAHTPYFSVGLCVKLIKMQTLISSARNLIFATFVAGFLFSGGNIASAQTYPAQARSIWHSGSGVSTTVLTASGTVYLLGIQASFTPAGGMDDYVYCADTRIWSGSYNSVGSNFLYPIQYACTGAVHVIAGNGNTQGVMLTYSYSAPASSGGSGGSTDVSGVEQQISTLTSAIAFAFAFGLFYLVFFGLWSKLSKK